MSEEQPREIRIDDCGGTIIAASWADVAKLYKKIAAAMAAVQRVEKDKKHGQGFAYTSWDETAEVIRTALVSAGLAHTVCLLSYTAADKMATVEIHITLADTETGAMKILCWTGQAADVADRAITKAATQAIKYCLSRTLLISADDDHGPQPERRQPATRRPQEQEPPRSHVDTHTGEIAPSADGVPFDLAALPPMPAADVKPGVKANWILDAAKAAGWSDKHTANWLNKHYGTGNPMQLNGQMEAAMSTLVKALTSPATANN